MNFVKYIFSVCLVLSSMTFASMTVVAHPSVADANLTGAEFQAMFLNKKKSWSDGTKVIPVVLKGGAVHDAFLAKVKKSASQFSNYWKQIIFTGKGVPPKEFATDAEAIAYIMATPGAVGYVSAATDGVKTINVN